MDSDAEFPWSWALAYVPVLGLSCLFSSRRQDEEFQFHARQGFVLFTLEILSTMLFFLPFAGQWIFGICVLLFAALNFRVLLELYQGKRYRIPVVSTLSRILEA